MTTPSNSWPRTSCSASHRADRDRDPVLRRPVLRAEPRARGPRGLGADVPRDGRRVPAGAGVALRRRLSVRGAWRARKGAGAVRHAGGDRFRHSLRRQLGHRHGDPLLRRRLPGPRRRGGDALRAHGALCRHGDYRGYAGRSDRPVPPAARARGRDPRPVGRGRGPSGDGDGVARSRRWPHVADPREVRARAGCFSAAVGQRTRPAPRACWPRRAPRQRSSGSHDCSPASTRSPPRADDELRSRARRPLVTPD